MKEFFHISKDISRITIDVQSAIKLLSSDLAILKMIKDYHFEIGRRLDSYEYYLERLDSIIRDVNSRLEKANPSYTLILNRRKEYLSIGYEEQLKPYNLSLEQYDYFKEKIEDEVELEKLINQIKNFIKGIEVDYSSLEINPFRIFFLEILYCIFHPKSTEGLIELISKKVNASVISELSVSSNLEKYDIWSDKFDEDEIQQLTKRLQESFYIEHSHSDYDFYFILSLRQTPYNRINDFLKFHFDSYEDNFIEFLKSSLDYFKGYLSNAQVERLEEWIKNCKIDSKETTTIKNPKIKQRSKKDSITSLSQEETATLFHYLKESKIILNDTTLQPKKEIAKAIFCMTGYSFNTISDKLSDVKKEKDKEILKTTQNKLRYIIRLIDKDLANL